jgi:hypothetical protein
VPVPTSAGLVTNDPDLTFLFCDAQVGGVNCSALLDTGAADCFVNLDFALEHQLPMINDPTSYELANGEIIKTDKSVRTTFRLHGYSRSLTLTCMPLGKGIDVILSDRWAKDEQAIIDYGANEPVFRPPSVYLGLSRTTLWPVARSSGLNDSTLISAKKALKLLLTPRPRCKPCFLVLVKEPNYESSSSPSSNEPSPHDMKLQGLLKEYESVFSDPIVGQYHASTPECIQLKPASAPPNRPPFRLSLPERQEVEKQVKELLETGRIVPSSSSYGAPVLFVPKPDGSLRMCIDYRELNKLTVRNKYPLPRIDDLMDNLSGAKYFSSMDLTSGYHQIVLHPNECDRTAFNTHIGKYEWRVMPFGLTNAPAVFQTVMNRLFGPALNKFLCVYLDDLLIFSQTPDEHLQHLQWVLERLKTSDLKARPSKCHFFRSQLHFLGHVVSANGLAPDPAKVETIVNWPSPRSLFEVRSFLGLTNYFRRFIQHYAHIAAPLTALLKGADKADRKGRLLQLGKL